MESLKGVDVTLLNATELARDGAAGLVHLSHSSLLEKHEVIRILRKRCSSAEA